MEIYLLVIFGPFVAALLLALVLRFLVMRSLPSLGGRVAALTALAGTIPALLTFVPRLSYWMPLPGGFWDLAVRTIVPLGLGIFAVVLTAIPPRAARTGATAELARRSVSTFVAKRWVWSLLVLGAVIVTVSIAAGSVSKPDGEGHYTQYGLVLGSDFKVGTGIYGWYYSIPALCVLIALLVITVVAWLTIPLPAWHDDAETDAAVRRLRTANIGRAASGALLVHLSVVLQSVAGTATLTGETPTTELGTVTITAPLAALAPLFYWTSAITLIAGVALWILLALTAVPTHRRRKSGAS